MVREFCLLVNTVAGPNPKVAIGSGYAIVDPTIGPNIALVHTTSMEPKVENSDRPDKNSQSSPFSYPKEQLTIRTHHIRRQTQPARLLELGIVI